MARPKKTAKKKTTKKSAKENPAPKKKKTVSRGSVKKKPGPKKKTPKVKTNSTGNIIPKMPRQHMSKVKISSRLKDVEAFQEKVERSKRTSEFVKIPRKLALSLINDHYSMYTELTKAHSVVDIQEKK